MKSLTRLRTAIATAAALSISTLALAQSADGALVPLDMSGERPTASMTINGVTRTVILDTGAGATVIFPEFADAAGLPRLQGLQASAPGQPSIPGFLSRLTNARLGDALVAAAPAAIVDLNLPLDGISGVASPNMFSGSLVRLDFGRGEMRILPRDGVHTPPGDPYRYYSTGFGRSIPAILVSYGDDEYEAILDTGNGRGLIFPLSSAGDFTLDGELMPDKPLRMAGDHAVPAFLANVKGTVTVGPLTFEDPQLTFADGVEGVNVGMAYLREFIITLDPENEKLWIEAAGLGNPG